MAVVQKQILCQLVVFSIKWKPESSTCDQMAVSVSWVLRNWPCRSVGMVKPGSITPASHNLYVFLAVLVQVDRGHGFCTA